MFIITHASTCALRLASNRHSANPTCNCKTDFVQYNPAQISTELVMVPRVMLTNIIERIDDLGRKSMISPHEAFEGLFNIRKELNSVINDEE